MRKVRCLWISLCMIFFCVACNDDVEDEHLDMNGFHVVEGTFLATVVEVGDELIVSPLEDEEEARSADLILVETDEAVLFNEKIQLIELADFQVGMTVEIDYDGKIRESYPAQITSFRVQIVEQP